VLAPASFSAASYELVAIDEDDRGGRTRWVTWQQVYVALDDWRPSDAVGEWLLNEFKHYMKEEGLDERRISAQDLDTLGTWNRWVEAEGVLSRVLHRADELIASRWATRLGPAHPGYGLDEYLRYPCTRAGHADHRSWEDSELRWACEPATDPAEGTSFWAGLWCGPAGPLAKSSNDRWMRSLSDDGFVAWRDRKWHWFGRTLPLQDLIALPTAQAQAHALADFILAAFSRTVDDPPPS
jgi:hypothetical protein